MNLLRLPLALAALLPPAVTAVTAHAQTPPPDPIAYSCYFCTDDEMEQVAIDQGVGEHYVYDANRDMPYFDRGEGIFGYTVSLQGGVMRAERFEPERWLVTQYLRIIVASLRRPGGPAHSIRKVNLLAPDSNHGRSGVSEYLWGHHTSVLNPLHVRARETLRRWMEENVDLAYMRADVEHGRVLQFSFQAGGMNPTTLSLSIDGNAGGGSISYYMDRATRRWVYLGAEAWHAIEESAEDFSGPTGQRQFTFRSEDRLHAAAFLQRAQWAGVPVQGAISMGQANHVDCTNASGSPVCTIKPAR